MSITLRETKGLPLTHAEMDGNLKPLQSFLVMQNLSNLFNVDFATIDPFDGTTFINYKVELGILKMPTYEAFEARSFYSPSVQQNIATSEVDINDGFAFYTSFHHTNTISSDGVGALTFLIASLGGGTFAYERLSPTDDFLTLTYYFDNAVRNNLKPLTFFVSTTGVSSDFIPNTTFVYELDV